MPKGQQSKQIGLVKVNLKQTAHRSLENQEFSSLFFPTETRSHFQTDFEPCARVEKPATPHEPRQLNHLQADLARSIICIKNIPIYVPL